MAITQMVSESKAGNPNVAIVRDYPGHQEGLTRHGKKCPHHGHDTLNGLTPECCLEGGWGETCYAFGPLYMETTHVGLVLGLGEHNWYDDSDFYALVWSETEGRPVKITYATTRGWTYPNHARVDATPEVVAKYEAYCEAEAEKARKEAAEYEARRVCTGKTVKVVRGRKVPKGFTGEVMWMGEARYGYHRKTVRVGIRDIEGNVQFTDVNNVEVVLQA